MAKDKGAAETTAVSSADLPLAKKLVFTAILIALPLLLIEGGARLWLAFGAPDEVRVDPARGAVETSWLSKLEQDLVPERPDVALYAPDLELFWTLRPETEALVENRVYKTKGPPVRWRIRINKDGHRGPAYPAPGGPADPVIVALGDSVTFGFRVNEDETYPAQLEGYLRSHGLTRARVVNYGVPGYTSFQGRRLLDRILAAHRPKIVLLAFGANDLESDRLSDAQKAARVSPLRIRVAQWLQHLAVARLLSGSFGDERRVPDAGQDDTPRVSQPEYRENMIAMIEAARGAGAEAILLDLVFISPVFRESNREIAAQTGVQAAEGRTALLAGLDQLLSGNEFQTERAAIDRFWDTRVERYRTVYYSKEFYRKLFDNPRSSAMLRYLMIEPVHPSALGHKILAEALGQQILAKEAD